MTTLVKTPLPFIDDWPAPPGPLDENSDDPAMKEVIMWRMQIMLAVHPWGIPSLAFHDCYRKMFARELDVRMLGFEHLSEMIYKLSDIFTVQEPDETTAILFPEYPRDRILHDTRLGHDFQKPNLDGGLDLAARNALAADGEDDSQYQSDYNHIIHLAWVNRDQDFPKGVVLENIQYEETFPMRMATVPGTRGLFQGNLVGAASPDSLFIRLNSNEVKTIKQLTAEIVKYFDETKEPIDAYSVPKEFIYPGFPCLVFTSKDKMWERCLIISRSPKKNKVLVESVDYGGVYAVSILHLYLIPRQFFDFPRQTLHVSLMGIKPSDDSKKWPQTVGSRMRCFSLDNYMLDFLIRDCNQASYGPTIAGLTTMESGSDTNSPSPPPSSDLGESVESMSLKSVKKSPSQAHRRRRIKRECPRFEVLVVDRNDTTFDIHLDEILVMETYAAWDESRVEDVKELKGKFKEALADIKRPVHTGDMLVDKRAE